MDRNDWLAERLEAQRTRMRALAYRMLASPSEADDAVQEASLHIAMLRLRRDTSAQLHPAIWQSLSRDLIARLVLVG